ncbi:MAG: TonB-dependent receptor [Xanthomonadales bacterium]|nr:TonB-dependent receptor [Xanthomonadales bacterium]
MNHGRLALWSGGALLLASCLTAYAQIEEILVTATKRAESRQDVPLSLQALTGDALQDLGADSADDILALFPNLSVNGSNEVNKGFTIRGVGTNNFHGNVNGAVGVYRDEVAVGTPFAGTLGIFDTARVEVLRGPQNTLFGRNTIGGAVNYISNVPALGAGFTGYLLGTLGSDRQTDLEGALGFELGTASAGRFAFQSLNRDGLFINRAPGREGEQLGERDRQSARLQVLWEPTEATSVLFNVHAGYNRGTNIGNKAIGLRDPSDPGQPCDFDEIARGSDYRTRNNCVAANGFNPSSEDWTTVYNVSSAAADIDVEGAFAKVVHQLPNQHLLTTITAFSQTRINQADDSSGFNQVRLTPSQDGDYEQISQELRIASPVDQRLRWLGGIYLLEEDMVLGTNVVNGGLNVVASNILVQEDSDVSLYGQFDYDVSPRLTAGLGLRYTDNRKRAPSSVFRVLPRVPNGLTDPALLITNEIVTSAPVVPVTIAFSDLEVDLSRLGGNLYARYRAADNVMFYASYAKGFKSGGFDTRAQAALTPGGDPGRPVEAEALKALEFGMKSALADGSIQLNAAAFLYEWDDLQSFVVVGGVPGFANIPESEIAGAEIELSWSPEPSWLIAAMAGFLHTEVTNEGNLDASVDRGHELTNAPELSAHVSVSKHFELATGRLKLQGHFRYAGDQKDTFLFANDPFSTKGSTTFVDLRAAYAFGDSRQYEVALWGENLTEEKTCVDIGLVDNPAVTAMQLSTTGACSPSEGQRRIGVSARISF